MSQTYPTDASASANAGTTPTAVRPAKPSRYARVYSGTSPESVTAHDAETRKYLDIFDALRVKGGSLTGTRQ
jgi:hypothetical protein